MKQTHHRLVFARPGGHPDYASLYRYRGSDNAGGVPLLVYVGGQTTVAEHAKRFETEPVPVLEQFDAVAQGVNPIDLDLLVVPLPPTIRHGYDTLYEDFADLFEDTILPGVSPAPPSAVAFVAYSLGVSAATYTALGMASCRGLCSLGGVGMARAARTAMPTVPVHMDIEVYRNASDSAPDAVTVVRSLPDSIRPWARAMPPRLGLHRFGDYARNGSAADAFRSALRVLVA